jgi:predicted acetyltransferase
VSDLEFRGVTEDEWPAFVETVRLGFGGLPTDQDVPENRQWPLERAVGAFEDGRPVGAAGAYDFGLTLPGLTIAPAAGVTWVSVRPTHRRRGALTGMMRYQLDDVHERGVPLAVQLASESNIYRRFGYGPATVATELELDRHRGRLRDPFEAPGQVRLVADEEEWRGLLPEIHDRIRRRQHGDVSRPEGWWKAYFAGAGANATGLGPRLHAIYENPAGEVEGFATHRIRTDQGLRLQADWTVVVDGLAALTFEAYVALWRHVTDLDLTAKIVVSMRPPDEPFRHLLAEPRRLASVRSLDFLWARVVDLRLALAARRYEVPGAVVLDVRDPFCPWNAGRWRLEGGPDGASCERTDATADLTLSATELGAVYLGGVNLAALAAARRVDEHATGAVARTAAMLATARAPWCQSFF